jgi:Fe-S cluster assembly protein SufD
MTALPTVSPAQHGLTEHSHGAGAPVPVQTRSERPRSYDPDAFGVPTGREVNWKFAPLDRLRAVLADEETGAGAGADAGVAYDSDAAPELRPESIGHEAPVRGEVFTPEDRAAAIAWTRSADALHHRIPAGVELDAPVRIRIDGRGADRRANAHLIVEAMPNSRGTVVLEHAGSAQYAQNVEIVVRDGAALTVVSVQRWDDDAVHLASHQARVGRDAFLKHVVVSFGGGVVRVNPSVELAGTGSQAELYGLAFSDAGQHLESQVYLHHLGAQTRGDVLYKGALQGATARTVWIGDVLIGPDAVGTDSYEANRNLVLTEGARADSIPNLEIETGDIAGAGHASATGRFDDEQMFYLQARGIPEREARRLVVLGFLAEIVQKIGVPALEEELVAAIEGELAATGGTA